VTVSENQQEPETTQPFEPELKLESPSIKDQSVLDTSISVLEDIAFIVEPVNVAKPKNSLEATIDTSVERMIETQPIIVSTSDSHKCVESRTSLQENWTLCSSMDSDDEMHDDNTDSNLNISCQTTINTPSSSTNQPIQDQVLQPISLTTNVSPPHTLLLDSIILYEVCENIFEDLNKLVKARNDPIRIEKYEDKWTELCVLFRSCQLKLIINLSITGSRKL